MQCLWIVGMAGFACNVQWIFGKKMVDAICADKKYNLFMKLN